MTKPSDTPATNIARAFAELRRPPPPSGVIQARQMTTGALKAMWDAFDGGAKEGEPGFFWPNDAPHIEDVHLILNERGEGAYCAV